tara:strand:+ start:4867 stop:5130 length:264 start_codon:yes stop_codon:yes gene_type:complete
MTEKTGEYMVLLDYFNDESCEEALVESVRFQYAFEEYQDHVGECHGVKVMRGDKDVTEQFKELLEEGDESHTYSFQRNEAKSGGHFK